MASRLTDTLKNGWHPEKEGTTFKGQMKSLVGRGKEEDKRNANHVARPISSLKDPSSFGPPPKHVAAGGVVASPISPTRTPQPAAAAPRTPSRSGYGAAAVAPYQAEAEEEAPKPLQPYRVDTTGLSTSHLLPPPTRRDGADGRSPPPAASAARPGPPSLPPRLPPRAVPAPSSPATTPSTSTTGRSGSYLNEGAASRLGAAGISVPALGIGRPSAPSSAQAPTPSRGPANTSQVNELQSRFARLGTSNAGASAPDTNTAPSEGTTLAQKQAALQTASNFRKDPSSVSATDARAAASTINNFRQRHGDQVAAGAKQAGALNEKYGIAGRIGGLGGNSTAATHGAGAEQSSSISSPSSAIAGASALLGKKKPPPPPAKKPGLTQADDDAPPPIPMSTRPQF